MSKLKNFVKTLTAVKKAGKAKIITITSGEKFIKKRNRPEHLNNLRKITMQVVAVGYSYQNLISGRMKKIDKTLDEYEIKECSYSKKLSENGIVRVSKKDDEKFYMRYYITDNNYYEDMYINEDDEIVELTQTDKDEWFTKKGSSKKQAEAGIEKEVKVRTLSLENLYYFQKGNKVHNALTEKVMALLDLEYVD